MAIRYKPILPSSLLEESSEIDMNYNYHLNNDNTLKVGVVTEIYEIEDKDNRSKLVPEYTVMTVGDENVAIYDNCMAMSNLGGIADFFSYKLRKTESEQTTKSKGTLRNQVGSIVLILCLKGHSEQAIIMGSLTHPDTKSKLTKDAGHHLEGEFNGVNWKVNKDGELTITYKSKTDAKGKAQDTEAGGTFVKIDKTGSVDINTGEDKNYVRLDKTNNDIGLKAGRHIGLTAKENIGLNADKNVKINAKQDLIAFAEGKASITANSSINIKTDGKLQVNAGNYIINVDDSMVLNTSSYIMQAETCVLNNQQTIIGPSPLPAVALTTLFLGTGNLGAPVISNAIGPFSSSVMISV